ncbi:EF-hand domain-containing protein [Geminicoccaceae bacterium 1502E]|nr:EF-hand domain-containing protein [Geminicoccaceae bacterium 1502E]
MRRYLICALAFLAGSCAGLDPGLDLPPPPTAFVAFDADGQQATLSRAEYEALGEAVFRALDVNGDGHLSQADFRRRFGELDRDGDGLIGLGEAPALVAAGDSDGDGRLSREEFERLDEILDKGPRR